MLYSHNINSKGAKLLASHLGCLMIRHENSAFKGDREKRVVNWGSSSLPKEVRKCKVFNKAKSVSAVNGTKWLPTLSKLSHSFDIPKFTTNKDEAEAWRERGLSVTTKDDVHTLDVRADHIFRVHQILGKTAYVQYKGPIPKTMGVGTKELIKRNSEALRALLELDFCAITYGWVESTHQFYILNTNTAPEMNEDIASAYAKVIKEKWNE